MFHSASDEGQDIVKGLTDCSRKKDSVGGLKRGTVPSKAVERD